MDHTTTSSALRDLYEALEMLDARQRASWRTPGPAGLVIEPVIDLRDGRTSTAGGPAEQTRARAVADWVPGDPR